MICLSCLQWRKRKNKRSCGSSQSRQTAQNIKPGSVTSEKAQTQFAVCRERLVNDTDYRECIQENSPTSDTIESWDQIASVPQKIHKMTPQGGQAQFGNRWHIVLTTAVGSNAKPTRQHPELGIQLHAPAVRKPIRKFFFTITITASAESFLHVLRTRSRILSSEQVFRATQSL